MPSDDEYLECQRCGSVYTYEDSKPKYICPYCGAIVGEARPIELTEEEKGQFD